MYVKNLRLRVSNECVRKPIHHMKKLYEYNVNHGHIILW